MRKILTASVTAGCLLLVPAAASASVRTEAHRLRAEVVRADGPRAPGRDIVRYGVRVHHRVRRATAAEIAAYVDTLRRMLTPPPVAAPSTVSPAAYTPGPGYGSAPAPVAAPVAGTSYGGGYGGGCGGITPYAGGGQCWAIPYGIVQCESHGQNIPNSQGSGAQGYYQLMSGGGGSRAQQDAAASALWAGGRGAGNWVCRG